MGEGRRRLREGCMKKMGWEERQGKEKARRTEEEGMRDDGGEPGRDRLRHTVTKSQTFS